MANKSLLGSALYECKDKKGRLEQLISECDSRIDYYERELLKERDTFVWLNQVYKILLKEEKKDEKV